MNVQTFRPASGESVVDYVIAQFRSAIQSGIFKPGDRIPSEFELMRDLNVSRNSLREAMKILSTLGIVEIRRGDGTYICSEIKSSVLDGITYSLMLESSDSEELAELRQVLDEDIIRLAILKSTPEEVERVRELNDKMNECLAVGDVETAAEYDYGFHQMLIKSVKNPLLERMYSGIYTLFEKSIGNQLRITYETKTKDVLHSEIIESLVNKDVSRVNEIVENSLSLWKNNAKSKITGDTVEKQG